MVILFNNHYIYLIYLYTVKQQRVHASLITKLHYSDPMNSLDLTKCTKRCNPYRPYIQCNPPAIPGLLEAVGVVVPSSPHAFQGQGDMRTVCHIS